MIQPVRFSNHVMIVGTLYMHIVLDIKGPVNFLESVDYCQMMNHDQKIKSKLSGLPKMILK